MELKGKVVGQLHNAVYNYYIDVYENASGLDRVMGTNILEPTNKYTFAEDMVVCLMFENIALEIDNYIKKMLKKHCKGNKQAYFEMILSTNVMSKLFAELGLSDESKLCEHWHTKLFFYIYNEYVTDDEIADMWRLR